MVPDGVRVVSALHTVSAATCGDLDHPLDEDVLVCGDHREDKERVIELIDLIDGPARRRRRAPGDGAHRRVADRAADLDQRAPQGARRDQDHRSVTAVVVVLAGGTGGAKLARGMLDVVGDELVVIANTADDVEIYGAYVSPDPDLCTFWLADRIDERGWGLRGDTFNVMDAAARARRRRLVQPRRPRPRHRPAPRAAPGRGRDARPRRIAELTRGARAGRARAADDRRARPHPRPGPRALGALPGVHDPRARRGPGRRRRAPGRRGVARARRPSSTRSRGARADRHRPVEPGHLDRARSSRCPASARRCARRAAPVVAVSPIVDGEVLKGPTAAFMAWAGLPRERGRDGAAPTTGCSTASWPTSPSTACPRSQTDTLMADAAARRRVAEDVLRFAEGLRR